MTNLASEAYHSYCSLVTFREVFFVNKVHRKPEICGAKSCIRMISVHREAVTGHGVNSNPITAQYPENALWNMLDSY